MILVLLGTFVAVFRRPLIELEKLCKEGIINEDVIVQSGYTTFDESIHLKLTPFFNPQELTALHLKARLIITHAGTGSIMNAMRLKKKTIAIARLAKHNEHVDDHQIEILEEFAHSGYILPWRELDDISTVLVKAEQFKPARFESGNSKIINYITAYIETIK